MASFDAFILVLHGYAATLRGAALQHVLTSKDVDYIEKNGIGSPSPDAMDLILHYVLGIVSINHV